MKETKGLIKVKKIELTFYLESKAKKVRQAFKEIFPSDEVEVGNDGNGTLIFTPAEGRDLFFKDLFYSEDINEDSNFLNLPRIDGGGGGKIVIFAGTKGIVISGFSYEARFYIPC